MLTQLVWLFIAVLAFGLGYSWGRAAGLRVGSSEGFVKGLRRSIAVQKPTEALCRALVPRPLVEYSRHFTSLLR